MTKYSFDAAMRAFEERYSIWQNEREQETQISITPWGRKQAIRFQQRATDFEIAAPIPEGMHPSLPVQLVALTQLALHLCKRRTPPYRVRREQTGSNPQAACFYVPKIDWEFHFDTLRLLTSERRPRPSMLQRANVLHPATRALIDISIKVYARELMHLNLTYEERQVLDPEQYQHNLIAKKMHEWDALPENSRAIKDWTAKHRTCEKAFLIEWTTEAKKRECFLLRSDLIYSSPAPKAHNFGPPSHITVRRDVAALLKSVRSDPDFIDATWMLDPYADLSGQWQLPLIALIPGPDKNLPSARMRVQKHWESVTGVTGKSLQSTFLSMDGEYRFIADEHAMFDDLDQHLLRAATYLFGTRLIADTSIDTVSTAPPIASAGNQLPAHPTHLQAVTARPPVLRGRDFFFSNKG